MLLIQIYEIIIIIFRVLLLLPDDDLNILKNKFYEINTFMQLCFNQTRFNAINSFKNFKTFI